MENILRKILNLEISADKIIEWLLADNPYDIVLSDVEQNDSTRSEFVSYFLDYLRNQCQSAQRVSTNDEAEIQHQELRGTLLKSSIDINLQQYSSPENIFAPILTNSSININSPIPAETSGWSPNETTPEMKTPIKYCVDQSKTHHSVIQFESPQSCSSPMKDMNSALSITNTPGSSINDFSTPNSSMTSANMFSPIIAISNSSQQKSTTRKPTSRSRNLSITTKLPSQNSSSPQQKSAEALVDISTPLKLFDTGKKNYNSKWASKKWENKTNSPEQGANSNKKKKPSPNRSLCLGDFINVRKGNSKNKNKSRSANETMEQESVQSNVSIAGESPSVTPLDKPKRRIKPTKILVNSNTENQQQETFGVVSRPPTGNLTFSESCAEISKAKSFANERELMKLQRQKHPHICPSSDAMSQELPKSIVEPKCIPLIIPALELVEDKNILDTLSNLYGSLLVKNLVPNPMTELYFIISLITFEYKSSSQIQSMSKENENSDVTSCNEAESLKQLKEVMGCMDLIDDNSSECIELEVKQDDILLDNESNEKNNEQSINSQHQYFNTAHNCVYFATRVLWNSKNLLSVCDRPTLALLCENSTLKTFSIMLHKFLNELYEIKCLQSKNIKPYSHSRTLQSNVYFQVETDNRDNFPSLTASSAFCKQRDAFYDLLQIWEEKHLERGWSFHKALGKKIATMISLHIDSVNYYHLARLFKSQLLISSIKIGQQEDALSDVNSDVLMSLKNLNPEKLQQLERRLVTPVSSIGPVPPPSFPGIQEFYKQFLESAMDPGFTTILQDCFIQEILELNDTQFACSDIDMKESKVDEMTKQNFLWCISNLRLMAKFLGFLVSLPYESKTNTLQYETTQIALRSRIMPPLDLRDCIYEAVTHKKLSLTVPWVVQYLAMLDSVSYRLPYYFDICKCLYYIYREIQYSLDDAAAFLVAFSIGWLFELPKFPRDIYFHWTRSYNNRKIELINDIAIYTSTSKKVLSITDDDITEHNERNTVLDKLDIIDDRALYICCPYLNELKLLLTSGNSNLNSHNANRHITPVSSKLSQASNATRTINLELQLEDAFFHGHPRSVRRTVDFVVERIVSSCVKFMSRTIIPTVKEKYFEAIKTFTNNIEKKHEVIASTSTAIRDECFKIIPEMCKNKTKTSMESLLADDILPVVKDMCVKIAVRMEIEQINQWLDSYINNALANDIFSKFEASRVDDEEDSDVEKTGEATTTDTIESNAPWATEVINDIRNSIWELLENNGKWSTLTIETITNNYNNLYRTLKERRDTVPTAQNVLYKLNVDYAIHLIAMRPDLFTLEVEKKMIEIWQMHGNKNYSLKGDIIISGLLNPRNVRILMLSRNNTVWIRYGKFIQQVLKHKLITIDNFSNDCVALFRHEWERHILLALSKCITEAIQDFKYSDECLNEIVFLLDWVIQTCGRMDDFS